MEEMRNKKISISNNQTSAKVVRSQAEYIKANNRVVEDIRADTPKIVENLVIAAKNVGMEQNMTQARNMLRKCSNK